MSMKVACDKCGYLLGGIEVKENYGCKTCNPFWKSIDSMKIKDESRKEFVGKINHLHSTTYQGHCFLCAENPRLTPMIFDNNGDIQNSKAEKIYTKYRLESLDGKYWIFANVSKDSITLENNGGDWDFVFSKSKKETVKAIAELFLKACGL